MCGALVDVLITSCLDKSVYDLVHYRVEKLVLMPMRAMMDV